MKNTKKKKDVKSLYHDNLPRCYSIRKSMYELYYSICYRDGE
ncbi:MAG: hypothetical protein ACLUD1_00970 [Clostridia bacterium]